MPKLSTPYSKPYTLLKGGFTLIELLVVISIIGILATLVSANMNSARSRARDAQRKSDARNISTALRLYYNDNGAFPAANASEEIMGCGATGITACLWGEQWAVGTTIYMQMLPKDPLPSTVYKYERGSDTDTYTLSACLENESDDKGKTTTDTAWCPTGWMFQLQP